MIEPISRGVLDAPHARGMTARAGGARPRHCKPTAGASHASQSHRFTARLVQLSDLTPFFTGHSTSRETNSASLRSSVVPVIIASRKHSEARHGEDASDR